MKRILLVVGTRPEAIKMAPVIKEFLQYPQYFDVKVCVTGQHREMLDQVLDFFDIKPDFDLDLMTHNQNLYDLTANIISGLRHVLEAAKPDYVFVHGDTTTTMGTSIATFYSGSKLCHVEAGLRTYNKRAPFPEEINRVVTGHLTDIHFAPTINAKNNLIRENIPAETVVVTGNTVIDALLESVDKVHNHETPSIIALKDKVASGKQIVLMTMHRRENYGEGVKDICSAILEIAKMEDVQIIYPVHRNPNISGPVYELLGGKENILLIDPQPYEAFIWLMDRAKIIITDSGGIQEEAPSLGKPVLVLREVTERPEAAEAKTVIMVGTNTERIVAETRELLTNHKWYDEMALRHNPYGDGTAAKQIVAHMLSQP